MHGKTYSSLNWRDRAAEVKLRAERVNDTLAGGDAALIPYGIRLINERGLHVYEDWPGLDRRKVSGSVWNPIGLAFLVALMRNQMFLLVVRLPKPSEWKPEKTRCAHRTWKSAKQLVAASREPALFSHPGIGRAWEEDTAARDTLLDLQSMALDRGAPVPLCRQQEDLTGRSSEKRSYLIERGVAYPGAAIGHGGATKQEKRRATIFAGQVNARIGDRRDLESHPSWSEPPGGADPAWSRVVLHEIYDVGTEPLKEPKVRSCKELDRADVQAFALAEWFETNHRRAQMRKRLPEPTSGPCRKLDGPVPAVSVLGGWLACGWRGGCCCRHVSCPLNDCRTPWTARSGERCDDD
jgi:hypothetical protein